MQGGEPIFGEKKLMGISFMRREGVLRVNLRGFLQGFFKGGNAKKGFCNTLLLRVCLKKIAHQAKFVLIMHHVLSIKIITLRRNNYFLQRNSGE